MTDVYRNPQTTPQDELFEPRNSDAADYPTEIAGPAGKSTLTENNERGILDATITRALGTYRQAELQSMHKAHRQGVYAQDNSYGD